MEEDMPQREYSIRENSEIKILSSEFCNYIFNKKTGFMATWGRSENEDPDWSPIGPFIADIELTDICAGIPDKNGVRAPCAFCYKSTDM